VGPLLGGRWPAFWPWIQLIRGSVATGAWSDDAGRKQPGLTLIAQMVPELRPSLPLPDRSALRSRYRWPTHRAGRTRRFVSFDASTNLFKAWRAGHRW
jgi:hypothetical protein